MRQVVKVSLITSVIVLLAGSAPLAQKTTLPSGRPFQILQDAINAVAANVDASITSLQTQLATLAGQVTAIAQYNVVQDQLIGALTGAANDLQQRMTNAEINIANLSQWTLLQDALLVQLSQRVAQLEATAAAHNNSLTQLFNLYLAQQNLINGIQNSVNFLSAQSTILQNQITSLQTQINANTTVDQTQQTQLLQLFGLHGQVEAQIASLNNTLTALNAGYVLTRNLLATGCPQGQSIRQVAANGPVVCEVDSGQVSTTTDVSATSSVGPLSLGAVAVSCPPAPAGQPPFLATGGGHVMSLGLNLFSSAPTGPATWQIAVFNPSSNVTPLSFTVIAHCVRQVIP